MNKRLTTLILGALTSFALLLSSPVSALVSVASMHEMMPQGQCQVSCGMQPPIGNQAARNNLEDKEAEPQPVEPFYISLITLASIATVVAIILKLYRTQWRPPDRLAMTCLLRI